MNDVMGGTARAADGVNYGRYGLDCGDPYRHRDLDARREQDRPLLLTFAGLSLDVIDDHLADAERRGTASAFLLSGREATGRTSLAKLIAQRYLERHGQSGSFDLVVYDEKDHDSLRRTQNVLKAVRNHLIRLGNWGEHRERLHEVIPDGAETDRPSIAALQGQADFLAHYMRDKLKPSRAVGLLIEGMQDDDLMDTLATVFAHVDTLVVVTRDDYRNGDTADPDRMAERERWQRWALHVTVPPLTGDDVERLTSNRWQHAAPDLECPFELDGIRDTFHGRSEPVGRALRWLGWLLRWRLVEHDGDECWPSAQNLRIPAQWIEKMVQQAETAPTHPGGSPRRAC
jgi:hypothetical protein